VGGAVHGDRTQPAVASGDPAVRDGGGDPDDLAGAHDARLLCAEEEGRGSVVHDGDLLDRVHVRRLLIGVYASAGLIYGIAALLLVARTQVGDPAAGQTDNLDSITAVVLGGTSLFGGRGNMIGTLIGALIVSIIRNGLTLLGVDAIYQVLITGILVILAVAADQLARRRQAV